MEHFIRTALLCVATVIVNTVITPYFIIAAFIILLAFVYLQRIVRSSYRSVCDTSDIAHSLGEVAKSKGLAERVKSVVQFTL